MLRIVCHSTAPAFIALRCSKRHARPCLPRRPLPSICPRSEAARFAWRRADAKTRESRDAQSAWAQQVRENTLQVVGKAYSSIALADLASRTGLSAEATKEEAARRGWAVKGGFVRPTEESAAASAGAAAPAVDAAALDRLTGYVCALERPSAAPDAVAVGEKALTAHAHALERGGLVA